MNAWLGIAIALTVGLVSALQTSMLGALGRGRAPVEAAWISLLGSAAAISAVLLIRLLRGGTSSLPAPLDRPLTFAIGAAVGLALLTISLRGIPWYYGAAGLGGVIYLATAALLVPRLGVAVFFGATTAGSVLGALALDRLGAFGAPPLPLSITRVGGMALLLAGVVVTRLGK